MSPKLTGSGDFPARIIRGKFADDLTEDLQRSPALRALVAGLCIAIVVLLASMGAVYTLVTVTGQRELREEMARDTERLERIIEAVRQDEQRREDVLRAELDRWKSKTDFDIARLFQYADDTGTLPPGEVPLGGNSQPFDQKGAKP